MRNVDVLTGHGDEKQNEDGEQNIEQTVRAEPGHAPATDYRADQCADPHMLANAALPVTSSSPVNRSPSAARATVYMP